MNRNQKILHTALVIWSTYTIASVGAYLVARKRRKIQPVSELFNNSISGETAVQTYDLNIAAIRRTGAVMQAMIANGALDGLSREQIEDKWNEELTFQKIAIREETK